MKILLLTAILMTGCWGQSRPMPSPFVTAGSSSGGSCSTLGGDLTGTCAAATVVNINGVAFTGTAGNLVKFNTTTTPGDSGIATSTVVLGAAALTTTGAIPIQSGTTGTLTQVTGLTYVSSVLTIPGSAGVAAFKFGSGCQVRDGSDGFIQITNSGGTAACALNFVGNGTSAQRWLMTPTNQANPYVTIQAGDGSATANIRIPSQKSTTGTNFACFDTNGQLVKATVACSGT